MPSLRRNESGLAAITVTLIILGIVTLITVGFATLMRREQRQALDQQLSTQAFYAAESGVNATREYIDSQDPDDLQEVTDCDDPGGVLSGVYSGAQLSDSVEYTCVLLDPSPQDLAKNLSEQESWVTKVEADETIDHIEISWRGDNETFVTDSNQINGNLLLQNTVWGDTTGVVRFMLMPDTNNRIALVRDTFQAMFYPNAHGTVDDPGTIDYPGTNPTRTEQGNFVNGNCNIGNADSEYCKVRINNIGLNSFYVRLFAIYNGMDVKIEAFNAAGEPLELINGQAKIDATGKAADVVRRIQVNVNLDDTTSIYPEFALESHTTVCKRFRTWPNPNGNTVSDVDSSNGTTALTDSQRAACEP